MDKMLRASQRFFDLSEEEKREYAGEKVLDPIRYGTSFNLTVDKALFWRDYLKCHVHPHFNVPSKPPCFRYHIFSLFFCFVLCFLFLIILFQPFSRHWWVQTKCWCVCVCVFGSKEPCMVSVYSLYILSSLTVYTLVYMYLASYNTTSLPGYKINGPFQSSSIDFIVVWLMSLFPVIYDTNCSNVKFRRKKKKEKYIHIPL